MKITTGASSIVFTLCFFLLAGCDSLGLPNLTHHDEVPAEVKAQPRLVETPTAPPGDEEWPRLGDVPFKPKDFTPKPVYENDMDTMDAYRAESVETQKKILEESPDLGNAAPQENRLRPPQFP